MEDRQGMIPFTHPCTMITSSLLKKHVSFIEFE